MQAISPDLFSGGKNNMTSHQLVRLLIYLEALRVVVQVGSPLLIEISVS